MLPSQGHGRTDEIIANRKRFSVVLFEDLARKRSASDHEQGFILLNVVSPPWQRMIVGFQASPSASFSSSVLM